MFNVLLYSFAKKHNSTKQPDPADAAIFTCELKDGTDILQPVFAFNFGTDSNDNSVNPTNYTYAKVNEFGRYYHIENWSWANGLWIAAMKVDTLATYKTDIGNAELYVVRSAARGDARVIDTKYPAIATLDNQITNTLASPWNVNIETATTAYGFFLVGVVNNDINAVGATAYYAFSAPAMRAFINKLYDSPAWTNITDANISTDLQKLVLNPIQYITSVLWIPYSLDGWTSADVTTSIPVGWWNLTLDSTKPAVRLKTASAQTTFIRDITIPKHPQAQVGYSKEWLNMSPYMQYALEFYPFGMIPIDASKLCGADKIRLQVKLDYITGIGNLRILKWLDGANAPYEGAIYSTVAQVGIPLALGQMSVDLSKLGSASKWSAAIGLGASSSAAFSSATKNITAEMSTLQAWRDEMSRTGSAAMSEFMGSGTGLKGRDFSRTGYAFDAMLGTARWGLRNFSNSTLSEEVKQAGSDIISGVIAATGVCESQGATGAFAQYTLPIYFTAFYSRIVETDVANNGIPLCEKLKINTLGGYTQVANADALTILSTPVEKRIVQAYLEGGFYYE
jgi:hypothetical protein